MFHVLLVRTYVCMYVRTYVRICNEIKTAAFAISWKILKKKSERYTSLQTPTGRDNFFYKYSRQIKD